MKVYNAPWIGLCEEEYKERCDTYDEDYEDYLSAKADDDYKREQEERDESETI